MGAEVLATDDVFQAVHALELAVHRYSKGAAKCPAVLSVGNARFLDSALHAIDVPLAVLASTTRELAWLDRLPAVDWQLYVM